MVNTTINNKTITINIDTAFEFTNHRDIRKAYDLIDNKIENVVINFDRVEKIDSSAIGMLLQIKDRCSSNRLIAKITGCSDDMKYILRAFHLNEDFELI